MTEQDSRYWRTLGALATYVVITVGGTVLLFLSNGSTERGLAFWIIVAVCSTLVTIWLWRIFGPLVFMLWDLDWNAVDRAMEDAKAEQRRTRRRR